MQTAKRGSRGADAPTRGAHCAPTAPNQDRIGDFHTWPGEMLEEVPPSPEGEGAGETDPSKA